MDETSHKTARQWPGAFTIFGNAYNAVKGNSKPALIVAGIYAALAFLSSLAQGGSDAKNMDANFEDIVLILTIVPVTVYGLALADGKKFVPEDFLKINPKKLLFIFGLGILMAIILFFSAIALIIPLIWTLAWFALSAMPLVDKNMGPIQALKESKRLSEKHKSKIWALIGVTVLLLVGLTIAQSVVMSILSGISPVGAFIAAGASFLVTIWMTTAEAMTYRWLQKEAK